MSLFGAEHLGRLGASLYLPAMTQAELNRIWTNCVAGTPEEGWGHKDHGDIHTLFNLPQDRVFARKAPNGDWVELPGMAKSKI